MRSIELRHLRYFIAVAEELNFRRAAERVLIDQTPLSRTIRDLEDRLGLQLFVRSPRKLQLTPAGHLLLMEAREVFIRIDRAYRVVRETDTRFRTPLRVGIADGIAQPKLSECFIEWFKSVPEIPLELVELRASELEKGLAIEEIDVGFSFGLPDSDAIEQQTAWTYPLIAIAPVGHELASQTSRSIFDLLAFPVLSYHAGLQPGLWQQMQTIVQRHTTAPTLVGEARTLGGYVTRIASGLAVGLIDAGHISNLSRTDVLVVPLVEEERVTTFVVHKRHSADLPDALQRFLTHATTLN